MELRNYQKRIAQQTAEKVREFGFCYIAAEVRTGKTLMALKAAELLGKKNVLFLTKKKAIKSIEDDYTNFGFSYKIRVINYESLHKIRDNFDLVICDEAHTLGAFPKPSLRVTQLRNYYYEKDKILLSGTPHPESYSQIFHQFYLCKNNPFIGFNFYQWAKIYVNIRQINYGYGSVNDYSNAKKEKILPIIEKYFIRWSQKASGFTSKIEEEILYVPMQPITSELAKRLKNDKVVNLIRYNFLADTPVKLMNKLHQIWSGTCIDEDGTYVILDYSKAEFIKEHFKGKKIGIFYKFKSEWLMLKKVFGDAITDNLSEFEITDKSIALQMVSGREGISLKDAEYLVFINIDFSAVTYFQARDRMTTNVRTFNKIFWIFAENGIEWHIYKAVSSKKDFTLRLFKNVLSL